MSYVTKHYYISLSHIDEVFMKAIVVHHFFRKWDLFYIWIFRNSLSLSSIITYSSHSSLNVKIFFHKTTFLVQYLLFNKVCVFLTCGFMLGAECKWVLRNDLFHQGAHNLVKPISKTLRLNITSVPEKHRDGTSGCSSDVPQVQHTNTYC